MKKFHFLVFALVLFGLASCMQTADNEKNATNNTTQEKASIVFEQNKPDSNGTVFYVPARQVTRPPLQHWFGYYDKYQFSSDDRYLLGMSVDFNGRSPKATDTIGIGMIDLHDDDKWIPLGKSSAWGWQQGCMLQWVPGKENTVIWNDRIDGQFVCHLMNVETKEESIIPFPIYTLSPDGKYGLSVDFRRINDMRPGYGYAGIPDPNKDVLAPENSGIYLVDMETGKGKFLISLADIAEIPYEYDDLSDAKHYFNHLLFNTDGSRFIFLHRWRKPGQNGFGTRMLTSDLEGKDIRTVDPYGYTSHFIWRDAENVLMWAYQPQMMKDTAAFYLIKDDDKQVANFVGKGVMVENGHCTYVPGTNKEWILNDTYPDKETRLITVFLYHVPTGKRVDLAKVYLPKEYKGEWRIDAHPRSSRDGKLVCIDSGCMGEGRQMIVMDISSIVGK